MKSKKYFISFDYEGLAGITNWQETLDNERCRELATDQLNAFLRGVFRSEPEAAFTIVDSHHLGNNLYWERLIGNVSLVKGYPRHFYMMEGIDASYNGLILFGYHAPAGQPGNMDHTYSSASIFQIRINDREVDEASINAMLASHYQVPLLFVYTDDKGAEWMKKSISSGIEFLVAKTAIGRYAARMKPYAITMAELEESGERLGEQKGFLFPQEESYLCRIILIDSNIAYAVQNIPGIQARGSREIEFEADSMILLYKYLMTIIYVASSVRNLYK
ncbi:MAG: M55 family metallopeptidase [Candidatus Cloacimonetes bacterium]|nr:M55 family metallopeptidase [Candidatus Cloacimonadota bacterium]